MICLDLYPIMHTFFVIYPSLLQVKEHFGDLIFDFALCMYSINIQRKNEKRTNVSCTITGSVFITRN